MKSIIRTYPLIVGSLAILLSGCGAGGTTPETKSTLHESTACIGCHDGSGWTTPGSGNPVVTEWTASTHNTNNGAGCADCHDDGYMHPASCSKCHSVGPLAKNPTNNPDRDGKCAKCHDKVNPQPGQFDGFKPLTYTDPDIPAGSTTAYTHFSTGSHANYVTTNYKQNCRKCHNPHDTAFGREQRKQWAVSGHGSTTSPFRTGGTDFKARGSSLPAKDNFGNFCVRCHTSTGYVNFINPDPVNGELFSNVQALPDLDGRQSNYPGANFNYQDKSRETTNCNVCHDDGRPGGESSYSGKLRNIPAFPIWYMYSSHPLGVTSTIRAKMNVQFDTLGPSNLCVVCHSGRETGDIIKIADKLGLFDYTGTTNATRPSGITPHDFSAGANLQGKSGFHFYTSASKYLRNPTHKTASTTIGGANGACIGCHMRNDQPHLYRPVAWLNDSIFQAIVGVPSEAAVCSKCHTGSVGNPQRSAAYMNIQRDNYRAAVAALGTMIPANRDWKALGNAIVPGSDGVRAGAYTMGANYVQSLFFNDPGAYTHNPTYTKQLIYDSIDWLADGKMDYGNASTQVYNKVNAISVPLTWVKGSPAVTYGQNGTPIPPGGAGVPFTKTQVLNFICKDYDIANPTVCNRW